jgi:hypothetical protein
MNMQGQPAATPAMQQTLQLEDIHLPPEPGFWPPAPGWWLLAALLMLAAWLGGKKARRLLRRHRQQQETRQTLHQIKRELDSGNLQQAITSMNVFLRKMALAHFPDEDVASLTGKQWLAFLDRSGNTRDFTSGPGHVLAEAPYQPALPDQVDRDGLYRAVENWVLNAQKHRHDPAPLYPSRQPRQETHS